MNCWMLQIDHFAQTHCYNLYLIAQENGDSTTMQSIQAGFIQDYEIKLCTMKCLVEERMKPPSKKMPGKGGRSIL